LAVPGSGDTRLGDTSIACEPLAGASRQLSAVFPV
jgi:hypothetical protein